jgi:integrase
MTRPKGKPGPKQPQLRGLDGKPLTDPNDYAGALAAMHRMLQEMAGSRRQRKVRTEPFASITDEFLESIAHRVKPGTLKLYRSILGRLERLFPLLDSSRVDEVEIERTVAAQGWSRNYTATFLTCLQTFVRWAGIRDFTLKIPSRESRGAEAVMDEETHAWILANTSGDFRQLVRFSWAMGCRPGEVAGIQINQVNWEAGTITLKDHKLKTRGKIRVLYLSDEALTVLREQSEKYRSGAAFRGSAGAPLTTKKVAGRFRKLSAKCGKRIFAMRYRHGFATRALLRGVPMATVAELLGHTGTAMVAKHYSHLGAHASELRKEANKAA